MIVVDSSVWTPNFRDAARPGTARLRQETARGNVLVGDMVLLEILRGARVTIAKRHSCKINYGPFRSTHDG